MPSAGEKILLVVCIAVASIVGFWIGYGAGREHAMAESAVLESTGHEIRTDALGRKVWVKVEP